MSPEFFKAVSVCSLSEEDYSSLGLAEGEGNVLVTTPFGQVVVSVRQDEGLPRGIIFIPMGPWANALVGPDTCGCGTPRFKGIEATVEPTMAEVKSVRELFRGLGRAGP